MLLGWCFLRPLAAASGRETLHTQPQSRKKGPEDSGHQPALQRTMGPLWQDPGTLDATCEPHPETLLHSCPARAHAPNPFPGPSHCQPVRTGSLDKTSPPALLRPAKCQGHSQTQPLARRRGPGAAVQTGGAHTLVVPCTDPSREPSCSELPPLLTQKQTPSHCTRPDRGHAHCEKASHSQTHTHRSTELGTHPGPSRMEGKENK